MWRWSVRYSPRTMPVRPFSIKNSTFKLSLDTNWKLGYNWDAFLFCITHFFMLLDYSNHESLGRFACSMILNKPLKSISLPSCFLKVHISPYPKMSPFCEQWASVLNSFWPQVTACLVQIFTLPKRYTCFWSNPLPPWITGFQIAPQVPLKASAVQLVSVPSLISNYRFSHCSNCWILQTWLLN